MIGPLGRQGPAATLGQHCPQMAQRPGIYIYIERERAQSALDRTLNQIDREREGEMEAAKKREIGSRNWP